MIIKEKVLYLSIILNAFDDLQERENSHSRVYSLILLLRQFASAG